MDIKKISYEEAYNELQQIAQDLEKHELPVDSLTKKVERAAELMNYCKDKLRSIEGKLDDLFDETE